MDDTIHRACKVNSTLTKRELQLHLLHHTLSDKDLLHSDILSSIVPKIGKDFAYHDLNLKKNSILAEARVRILKECSIPEANRDILKLSQQLRPLTGPNPSAAIQNKLRQDSESIRHSYRKQHHKKIHFFSTRAQPQDQFPSVNNKKRKGWRQAKKKKKKEARSR